MIYTLFCKCCRAKCDIHYYNTNFSFTNLFGRKIREFLCYNKCDYEIKRSVIFSYMVLDEENGLIYGFSVLPTCESDILEVLTINDNSVKLEVIPTQYGYGTGTLINAVKNGEIVESYIVIIFGDATGDAVIDESDFVMIDLYIAMLNMPEEDSPEFMGMDCNRDGIVDESDIVLVDLLNAFMGEIDQLNGGIILY